MKWRQQDVNDCLIVEIGLLWSQYLIHLSRYRKDLHCWAFVMPALLWFSLSVVWMPFGIRPSTQKVICWMWGHWGDRQLWRSSWWNVGKSWGILGSLRVPYDFLVQASQSLLWLFQDPFWSILLQQWVLSTLFLVFQSHTLCVLRTTYFHTIFIVLLIRSVCVCREFWWKSLCCPYILQLFLYWWNHGICDSSLFERLWTSYRVRRTLLMVQTVLC